MQIPQIIITIPKDDLNSLVERLKIEIFHCPFAMYIKLELTINAKNPAKSRPLLFVLPYN